MYWQDEKDTPEHYKVPDDIVDIFFKVKCTSLPLDHIQVLSDEIHRLIPWIADEKDAAIPAIHVAESGNGWIRPEDPDNEVLYLSRRTRMSLRIPQHRKAETMGLSGKVLDISGNSLEIGTATERTLSKLTTIFSRYISAEEVENEDAFMQEAVEQLKALDIRPRKMMPGKIKPIQTHNGKILTRSLLLADLEIDESVRLQQKGLGSKLKLGCGIFLPHKGIDAVRKPQENEN